MTLVSFPFIQNQKSIVVQCKNGGVTVEVESMYFSSLKYKNHIIAYGSYFGGHITYLGD